MFVKELKEISKRAEQNSVLDHDSKEFFSMICEGWKREAVLAAQKGLYNCDIIKFTIDSTFHDVPIKELLFKHNVYERIKKHVEPAVVEYKEYLVKRDEKKSYIVENPININGATVSLCVIGIISVDWST